jgi:hypothetical protein
MSIVTLLLFLLLYFLPAIIASNREHPQLNAIGVINILLGWTVIGWIAALVWALSAIRRREEVR